MAAASPIRLLLVSSADAAMPGLIRTHLKRTGQRYRLHHASVRERFYQELSHHSPDLIITHVNGGERLGLSEILQAAEERQDGIPVIVLGRRRGEQSSIRILRKDTPGYRDAPETGYLDLKEIACLSSLVEHSLSGQRTRINQLRLENEVRRATNALRESQRLVTIGRLAGSIAHEINNPLEAIGNLFFLIEHEPSLTPRVQDYLKMAQKELDRVVHISKQTLNFYRETTSPVPTQLSELMEDVLVLYARRLNGKQIEVIRRFGDEDRVNIFPGEIRQVFSNLVANAIEASGERGKLHLRIRKSRFWGDPGITGLRVTVADTGKGMSAEVRRHIGEPFFTTKGQGGTGLGLWLSQSITERYGGNLQVRSSTGERHGTVFSIFLPSNLRPRAVEPGRPDEPKRVVQQSKSASWRVS